MGEPREILCDEQNNRKINMWNTSNEKEREQQNIHQAGKPSNQTKSTLQMEGVRDKGSVVK